MRILWTVCEDWESHSRPDECYSETVAAFDNLADALAHFRKMVPSYAISHENGMSAMWADTNGEGMTSTYVNTLNYYPEEQS